MRYARCPKCGHAPLPREQALPAACPACGLILAKWGASPPMPRDTEARAASDDEKGRLARLRAAAFHVPDSVPKAAWQGRMAALAVFALWTLWILWDVDIRKGEAGSGFLHLVLLPFHEAGHYAIFRWFGEFIMTLGGTLGQHLMPIAFMASFLWWKHDPFAAALLFWLLGFSTLDMAIYMYDAFDPKLMLLGGSTGQESDGHDWQNIFGDLGLIRRARGIGLFFGVVGMAMMLAALAWAWQVLRLQHEKLERDRAS